MRWRPLGNRSVQQTEVLWTLNASLESLCRELANLVARRVLCHVDHFPLTFGRPG